MFQSPNWGVSALEILEFENLGILQFQILLFVASGVTVGGIQGGATHLRLEVSFSLRDQGLGLGTRDQGRIMD